MLTYFCCPAHVVSLLRGKPHSLVVLINLILRRNTATNNTYFMSLPKLTKVIGISQRQIYNSIDVLKDLGLIEELANRKGDRMFHLPFLVGDADAGVFHASETVNGEGEPDPVATVEYQVSIPDNPTAAEIDAMSSEELVALWNRDNRGVQNGKS